jgi:YesN/AraC family two-component response regulator
VVRSQRPDMLFTDIRMPNMSGLTMIAALRSEFPAMQIAVLTAHRDFEYAQQAIKLGVTRYLLKPSKMEELVEALQEMTARLISSLPPEAQAEEAEADAESAPEASSYVLQCAVEYIRAHSTEHLRLSDVADAVFVSQWHLSKLINRYTGQTFNDLLNQQRVERARELLLQPSLKVHEVAELVGFSDVAHFSKTFKKLAGKSPVDFRIGGKG